MASKWDSILRKAAIDGGVAIIGCARDEVPSLTVAAQGHGHGVFRGATPDEVRGRPKLPLGHVYVRVSYAKGEAGL